jgi:VWFA-related protein
MKKTIVRLAPDVWLRAADSRSDTRSEGCAMGDARFRLRGLHVVLVATCLLAAGTGAAGDQAVPPQPAAPSQPVFRTGIELVTVDVTALDGEGRQVRDLTAADFTVQIDGQPRQVVSAEYVRLVDPARPAMTAAERDAARKAAMADREDPFFSSNAGSGPPGRLVVVIIDQGNIRAGQGRSVMDQARRFVDTLQPEDRVAVAVVPMPGELVDFTTDHDRVKEALARAHGAAFPEQRRFNISMTEAIAIYQNSDARLTLEVIARECGPGLSLFELEQCERDVEREAFEAVAVMRQRSSDSIRAIRDVLVDIGRVEGAKQVILISEGLILEHMMGDLDNLASLAADARASLDILMLDVPHYDVTQARRPTTPREDRRLQEEGLEILAGLARGGLYRISTTATYAFDQISRAITGYYLLGVEARPSDRDGRQHGISVRTTRRGVTLRSRRTFLTGLSGAAGSPADAVSRAIRSPLPARDLPMRMSTWMFKEPGTTRLRMLVAVEVERLADQPLDYTVGMAVIDRNNRAQVPEVASKRLAPSEDPTVATLASAVLVDPGTYRLRVAMADSEGRVGSVERTVDAFHIDGSAIALGDLLLGRVPSDTTVPLEPAVEPRVPGAPMAAIVEAYLPAGETASTLSASLDVLRTEDGPAISSLPMRIGQGRGPEVAIAQAVVNTSALPPGRYLARATLRQGNAVKGHLVRPFLVAAGASASTSAALPAGLPPDLQAALTAGLPAFDRQDLLSPALLASSYAAAEGRGKAAAAAVKEARAGQLGPAAMTALAEGDQVVAAFLKGLDLLSQGQLDRAAVQFQTAVQQAPQFAPARTYLGATLAAGTRHREAAGLLQSGVVPGAPPVIGRLAGQEWLRAGQAARAIEVLEPVAAAPDADPRARKALALAYVLDNRAADAVPVVTAYLASQPDDREALVAGIYALYTRHRAAPQGATLAADRRQAQAWLKALAPAGGAVQPLAAAWVRYLEDLRDAQRDR